MNKFTKKQIKIVEKYFDVYDNDEDTIELERWTDGGVDMFIVLDKTAQENFVEQLENYCEDFDIDEEIDLMRENKEYRQHFTIRESLEDYEEYIDKIRNIIEELKGVWQWETHFRLITKN